MTSLTAQRARAADAPVDRDRLSHPPSALRDSLSAPSGRAPRGAETAPLPESPRDHGARLIDLERRARFGRFGFDFA
jgi:hypothetical protein